MTTNSREAVRALVEAVYATYCGPETEATEPDDSKVSFPEDQCHITFGMIRQARAALLTAEPPVEGGEWAMELAREIKSNAEDHPDETMSRFALFWADTLAARSVAALTAAGAAQAHPPGTPMMPAGRFHDALWKTLPESLQGYGRMLTQSWATADSTELKQALEAAVLALAAQPTAGAAQGGGDREALLRQMEALEAEWCEASAGRPSSRRIATFDMERNTRGEDDFDNEVFARTRCASQLAMLIARARSSTPTPAAQPSDGMPAIWHRLVSAEAAVPDDWRVLIREAKESIATLWNAAQPSDAVRALHIAHRHLDMGRLRVSHANDAAIIDTALSSTPAAVGRGEWRPIETAPLDGTVIVIGNSGGSWAARYRPYYQSGFRPDNPWQSMMLNRDHIPDAWRFKPATHWRPLDAAIAAEQGDDNGAQ